MDSKHLMLNQLKTKYIEFAPFRSVGSKVILELNLVHCEKHEPSASVTNLGIPLLDDKFLLDKHVN